MNSAAASSDYDVRSSGHVLLWWRSFRHRWRGLEYGLQGLVATGLALYVSFLLEMKAPFTAAVTVWVVAGIKPGQVLSKSFYRLIGTLVGGIAAVALIGLFDQIPWMFFTGLAIWVGLCTGIANLFRNFRAYGGVLAGYTAGMVVIGAIAHPDQVLDTALDRVASVIIGLLSATLIASLFGARQARAEVEGKLQQLRADTASHASALLSRDADPTKVNARLVSDIVSLETMMEYAAVESPEFRFRVGKARALVNALLGILESIRALESHLSLRPGVPPLLESLRDLQQSLLLAIEKLPESSEEDPLVPVRQDIELLLAELERELSERGAVEWEASLYFVARQIDQLSTELNVALEVTTSDDSSFRPVFRPDYLMAGRHALRAIVGVLAASFVWSITQWQDGPNFLLNALINCALLSTAAHPAQLGGIIMKSTVLAALGAFLCVFGVMPLAAQIGGFTALMLCLAVFLLPGGFLIASPIPWLSAAGGTFGVFFLTVVQPTNVATYDPARLLENGISMLAGAAFSVLCFLLIFPTQPGQERRRWLKAMRRDLQFCAALAKPLSHYAWRALVCERIRSLREAPGCVPEDLGHSLAVIIIGRHILQLRALLAEGALPQFSASAIRDSLHALTKLTSRPAQVPCALRAAIAQIQADSGSPDARLSAIAHLEDISGQWESHSAYFLGGALK